MVPAERLRALDEREPRRGSARAQGEGQEGVLQPPADEHVVECRRHRLRSISLLQRRDDSPPARFIRLVRLFPCVVRIAPRDRLGGLIQSF